MDWVSSMGDFVSKVAKIEIPLPNLSQLQYDPNAPVTEFNISGRKFSVKMLLKQIGSYTIYEVGEQGSNTPYYIRRFHLQNPEAQSTLQNEINSSSRATSGHKGALSVKFCDTFRHLTGDVELYIVYEYAVGRLLAEYIRGRRDSYLSEAELLGFIKQLCEVVETMHKRGVVHKDIRVENIIITDNNTRLRLLGYGNIVPYEPAILNAPEMSLYSRTSSTKIDIWGIGAVSYKLAYARDPYDNTSQLSFPKTPKYSLPVRTLLSSMLERDPERRPDISAVVKKLDSVLVKKKGKKEPADAEASPKPSAKKVAEVDTKKPVPRKASSQLKTESADSYKPDATDDLESWLDGPQKKSSKPAAKKPAAKKKQVESEDEESEESEEESEEEPEEEVKPVPKKSPKVAAAKPHPPKTVEPKAKQPQLLLLDFDDPTQAAPVSPSKSNPALVSSNSSNSSNDYASIFGTPSPKPTPQSQQQSLDDLFPGLRISSGSNGSSTPSPSVTPQPTLATTAPTQTSSTSASDMFAGFSGFSGSSSSSSSTSSSNFSAFGAFGDDSDEENEDDEENSDSEPEAAPAPVPKKPAVKQTKKKPSAKVPVVKARNAEEKLRDTAVNQRHDQVLKELLKIESNKTCADCGVENPDWASVNIGVFVCLRCSGIHRSMGTHISKVRSVNLDTWTPDQLEVMKKMGNAKAARIWEAKVPPNHPRPQDGGDVSRWIRDKYELGRFKAPTKTSKGT